MNQSESGSERGFDDVGDRPKSAGAPDPYDIESTQARPMAGRPESVPDQPVVPDTASPVLGIVVAYSDVHGAADGELDPRLGRAYPLRANDILFLGRHPAPAEILRRNGNSAPPTHCHLFPHGEPYGYVSRRHLTVEMDGLGGAVVTDYSRYGIYLERAAKWHRRQDPDGQPESHRVDGNENVVLMDDLGDPADGDLSDRRSHYRIQILPAPRSSTQGAMETPS